jgi:hypothetical protein
MDDGLSCSKQYLTQPNVIEKLRAGVSAGKHRLVLDSTCYLLNYVGDVVAALCPSPPGRATSPPWEGELPPELDSDWTDDLGHEDDESGGEDSVSRLNAVLPVIFSMSERMKFLLGLLHTFPHTYCGQVVDNTFKWNMAFSNSFHFT